MSEIPSVPPGELPVTPTPGPSVEAGFHGSFVVTTDALKAFEQMLTTFVRACADTETQRWLAVWTTGPDPVRYPDVASVAGLRNPKTAPISIIAIAAVGPNRRSRVVLSTSNSADGGVLLHAEADDAAALSSLVAQVNEEQRNIRTWYWWIRFGLEHAGSAVVRLPYWLRIAVFIALVLVFVGGPIWTLFHSRAAIADWRQRATEVLSEAESAQAAGETFGSETKEKLEALRQRLNAPITVQSVWMLLGAMAFCWTIGALFPHVVGPLFPRMAFEIGEGKARHDRIRAMRTFALGTVVVSGLALPLLRKWGGI